jgi:hypothetical protein
MDAAVAHVASAVAMLVHATLLPAGCGAVAALVVMSRLPASSRRSSETSPDSRRADRLRALAAGDRLTLMDTPVALLPRTGTTGRPEPSLLTKGSVPWQLAAVCTTGSAVAHAVATPHHATENVTFGVFFFLSAFVQFGWATVALTCPSTEVLWHGVALNVLLIELWVVTRTIGLPFGLQNGPEGLGAWDVAAKVWELGALACCLHLLLTAGGRLTGRGRGGSRVVRAVAVSSLAALLVLAWTGAPA